MSERSELWRGIAVLILLIVGGYVARSYFSAEYPDDRRQPSSVQLGP